MSVGSTFLLISTLSNRSPVKRLAKVSTSHVTQRVVDEHLRWEEQLVAVIGHGPEDLTVEAAETIIRKRSSLLGEIPVVKTPIDKANDFIAAIAQLSYSPAADKLLKDLGLIGNQRQPELKQPERIKEHLFEIGIKTPLLEIIDKVAAKFLKPPAGKAAQSAYQCYLKLREIEAFLSFYGLVGERREPESLANQLEVSRSYIYASIVVNIRKQIRLQMKMSREAVSVSS